jgi:hypothetical protein
MPTLDLEDWRSALFFLLYQQYGGSGLHASYADLMEMELTEVLWLLERLHDMREKESDAVSRARGG